jgi:Rieske Fe-S protein
MEEKQSRRKFLSTSAKVIGGAMLLPLISACGKTVAVEGKTVTYDLPEDGFAVAYPEDKIIISRLGTSVYALTNVCTHLGETVGFREDSGQIVCPLHKSKFDLTGDNIGGPADSGLQRFKATITGDNKVEVNFSKFYAEGKEGYEDAVAKIESGANS